MNDLELVELAFNSLRYRSLRSWLAILGIVIAVASIISLISISVGMNDQITKSLSGTGANIITISPGAARAERFGFGGGSPSGPGVPTGGISSSKITFLQADALRRVLGVAKVDAQLSSREEVRYKNKNSSVTVIGVDPSAFPESVGTKISSGRTLGTSDTVSAVLGYSVAAQTFNDSMLNKQITIEGKVFHVVGILNQSGSTFSGPDRNIYIPQEEAKKLFNQTKYVSSVVVVAADGQDPDAVAGNVTAALRIMHRVTQTTQDFTVTTATSLQSTISSVTDTLGLFLGGIASISLIVGGIGVANAMFTSVLEQTKYIGLLKSLGTKNSAVLKLFLFEACMVGLVGGLIGIALSFVASAILGVYGLPSRISPDLAFLGIGFSVVVGAISGILPARNAASVAPVEALKYE
jgi:putative ABC transport system permease protein